MKIKLALFLTVLASALTAKAQVGASFPYHTGTYTCGQVGSPNYFQIDIRAFRVVGTVEGARVNAADDSVRARPANPSFNLGPPITRIPQLDVSLNEDKNKELKAQIIHNGTYVYVDCAHSAEPSPSEQMKDSCRIVSDWGFHLYVNGNDVGKKSCAQANDYVLTRKLECVVVGCGHNELQ